MIRARILGSAAGGGFPQWNCACVSCAGVRAGTIDAQPRTQIGAAVTSDGERWFLLGASPDIRAQLASFPALWPRGPRDTPVQGIVLTNGDLDACLGLFSLRESQPLEVWATPAVREGLARNAMMRTLERFPGQTTFCALELGATVRLTEELTAEVLAVPGKVPKHLEGLAEPSPEDNVGLILRAGRSSVGWFPGVGAPSAELVAALDRVDAIYFDGTFWSSDELVAQGLGTARAEDMAHWPLSGPEGSLETLARAKALHRFLVHVNNTNPILRESSEERAALSRAGIVVAHDGMDHTW